MPPAGDPGRDAVAGTEQLLAGGDLGHQPDPGGLGRVHVTAGEHDLKGAGGADGAGQQVAQAQLGRGQPVVDARRAEVGALRGDPDVAGERQAQAAADRGAVDRPDHRLVHLPQGQDDVVQLIRGSR
jgi:hypothetical protein